MTTTRPTPLPKGPTLPAPIRTPAIPKPMQALHAELTGIFVEMLQEEMSNYRASRFRDLPGPVRDDWLRRIQDESNMACLIIAPPDIGLDLALAVDCTIAMYMGRGFDDEETEYAEAAVTLIHPPK